VAAGNLFDGEDEGLPAVLLGLVTLIVLRNGPEDVHWLTAEQRAWLSNLRRVPIEILAVSPVTKATQLMCHVSAVIRPNNIRRRSR
jgi:hypothetical protein